MKNYTPKELQQALELCASEPIHQVGRIQSHGAMIVISAESTRKVLQISANLAKILQLPEGPFLGKSLADVIGEMQAIQIEKLISKIDCQSAANDRISFMGRANSLLYASVFCSSDMFVIEFTPEIEAFSLENQAQHIIENQRSLLSIENEIDLLRYLEKMSELTRNMTQFDRVMIYRFDTNWDGEVIAEARIESAESYLGSRFPASDIPPQARELYTQNRFRLVVDVEAKPVALVPDLNPVTGQPLDMTLSILRSFSPVHVEYLRNMGVKASMSISLLQGGRLWGLIACHHMTSKSLSSAMQDSAVRIGQIVSTRLSAVEAQQRQSLGGDVSLIVGLLLKLINIDSVEVVLGRLQSQMLTLLDSTGLIVIIEGHRYSLGQVPDQAAIDGLLAWLGHQSVTEVFSCNDLSTQYPPAAIYDSIASGIVASPVSADMRNCMIWFRPERLRTVCWAGSPHKSIDADDAGNIRLSPRKSFETWTELWRGRSASWTVAEIDAAAILAQALTEGIAQKARLEQSLAAQRTIEKRYALALDATNDGIWDWNIQTGRTITNPAFSTMLGFSPDELGTDSNTDWIHLLHPDDRNQAYLIANEGLKHEGRYDVEFRLQCKDGSYKWILSRGTVLERDHTGHPLRAIGTHTDLTVRKQMEIQLREAKELAEVANRAKSNFLSNMSHELLTPLNCIMGMTELVYRQMVDPDASKQLEKALVSARQLKVLINDLMNFSKIEGETLTLEQVSFCLADILQGLKGMVNKAVARKVLRFNVDVSNALARRKFRGDPARLGDILSNLVGNALKFTEQGEVKLRIAIAEDYEPEVLLRFEIEDTGIGIASEDQHRLFTLFEQGDGSSTRKYGGTGLGLMLSKRLAELMGGDIGLIGKTGVGSIFWFTVKLGVIESTSENDSTEPYPFTDDNLDVSQENLIISKDGRANETLEPETINLEELKIAGCTLLKLIERNEIDAFDELKNYSTLFRHASPTDFQRLIIAMEQFDFEVAEEALRTILQRHAIVS